ncbi:MAG: tRNA lysidine(34) synthetase TilS [Roseimicrobium sp.]
MRLGLNPVKPALMGVSGGRDSVALLHFLVSQGWKELVVCHLNHGLRGRESGQDAAFVRRLAARYGLRCEVGREDVAALAEAQKLSTETAARLARDAFFQKVAQATGTAFVFLAHHAEDNAETVLGNLCRGAGLAGLSGMALASEHEASGLVKLRPLLAVRRAEIDAYIKSHGLAYREDGSNASLEHRRNRFRHEVLPLLVAVCRRDVVPLVCRAAKLAARDEAFLSESAIRFAQEQRLGEPGGALRITPALKGLHPALQSRVLRDWLVGQLGLAGIGSHEVGEVTKLLAEGGPAKINLPGGHHVRRKAKRLFVEQHEAAAVAALRKE